MNETINIMIVDDNPDDRSLAIRELKKSFKEIEVIEVVDSKELKTALDQDDFDLVITDYRIRWTNGIKVLKEVKKHRPDCPVIMFTGTGNEEVAVRAMKSGLDDYVVKSPKHFIRLSACVQSVLENAKIRREKRKLEELYNRLFERVPVGLYSVDAEGRIFAANSALIELLGFQSKDEIHSYRATDFHPDEKLRRDFISKLKDKDVIKGHEVELERKDGEHIWVKENAYVTLDENGEVRYIEGSIEDITAIKNARRDLETQKEKIEKLHDVASKMIKCGSEDEVYQLTIDSASDILDLNVCTITLVEGDSFSIKAASGEVYKSSDIPKDTGILGKTYAEKKSFITSDIKSSECAEPYKTTYNSAMSIPIGDIGVFQAISFEKDKFDENDLKMAEILISHTSGTLKRIRYEKKIIESEKRYRNIFESTGTAMVILDRNMGISMINNEGEKLLGYSSKELNGNNFTEFVLEEELKKVKNSLLQLFDEEEERTDIFLKLQNRYHDVREVFLTASPMTDSNLVLVSMIDITQQKRNLVTLEEIQEMFLVAFEGVPLGMLLLNAEGQIIEGNQMALEITGYSENELLSMKLIDLVDEEEPLSQGLERIIKGEVEQFSTDVSLEKKDGSLAECGIKTIEVKKDGGELNSIIVYFGNGEV
ncbi:MAG: PAS domain S-box protein [Thermoplasmata archaeon]